MEKGQEVSDVTPVTTGEIRFSGGAEGAVSESG